MKNRYSTIGLIGKPDHQGASATIETLERYLIDEGYKVLIEDKVANSVNIKNASIHSISEIGEQANLAIVVGGDGYMLGAARVLAYYNIDVILSLIHI